MKVLIRLLISASGLLAASKPATTPIPTEYSTMASGIFTQLQKASADATAALEKVRMNLCKEKKIKPDVCVVDWQHGTVSTKPKDEPKPAETPKQ